MKYLAQLYENLELSWENGLVEVKNRFNWEKCLPEGIKFSSKIVTQLNIIQPDAFYHFSNIPLILFFENPANEDIYRIHSQSWCFNQAPVVFIVKDGDINVYNAFRYKKEEKKLENLGINESDIKEHFSFWDLQSGNTWRWIEKSFLKEIKNDRVDRYLLKNIRTAVTQLGKKGLPVKPANKIILKLIFVRYIIDRGVIIDEKYIDGKPFEKESRKKDFNRLISDKPGLFRFFDHLKERFNGNLFEIDDKEKISQTHLNLLSALFEGQNLETGEQVLFDVYDFSIIPVELISGIYESIVDEKKREENATIYTPTFLVDYILQQTVEKYLEKNNAQRCKVLDPACGSGIFLVESYRRMVEKEKSFGEIPDNKLVELLKNNIYGIDKDEVALSVAIFSLYIALLDYKEPRDIREVKLPDLLNKKLFCADFFDTEHPFNEILKKIGLKFIIGNPPWKKDKTDWHLRYIGRGKNKLPVSRYEISQTFLLRTKDFYETGLRCALIVSSKAFYNLWAKKFKKYFFKKFYVEKFFDLSPARRLIFEDAINPAIIIFYHYASNRDTQKNIVNHCSIKPNLFLKNFNALVIEKYDQKELPQKYLIEYDWILKTILYGNTIDFYFLSRLKKFMTIKEHINILNKNEKVIFLGDGIKRLTPNAMKKLSWIQKERIESFKEIANTPIIEMESIDKYYSVVDRNNFPGESDLFVKSGRVEELYKSGDTILIKSRATDESELVISYVDTVCVYREKTLGITSKKNGEDLKYLYGILNSNLSTYFQFLTSSSWGIFFPEIAQAEYLSFPYAEISGRKRFIDLVKRFINYYKEHYSNVLRPEEITLPKEFEQINEMVNEAYNIDEIEKDLIDYVLNVSRYLFQENKAYEKALRRVEDDELKKYAQIFYNHFSSIYNSTGEYFQVEYFYLDYFIAMKFKIVPRKPPKGKEIVKSEENNPDKIIFNALAQKTSLYKITNKLYLNKVINGFEEDFFYIIKPNEFKSWHQAFAHIDLAEFMGAINKAELEQMKEENNG